MPACPITSTSSAYLRRRGHRGEKASGFDASDAHGLQSARVRHEVDAVKRLNPAKLHTVIKVPCSATGPISPRRYTLTHSDITGDLFLTIGAEYDRRQISGLYTRLMRDEVLAEWVENSGLPKLSIHCHVSGGLVFGTASMRDTIFHQEMPLVLEALRYGDRELFAANAGLGRASIEIDFHSANAKRNRVETWGTCDDWT